MSHLSKKIVLSGTIASAALLYDFLNKDDFISLFNKIFKSTDSKTVESAEQKVLNEHENSVDNEDFKSEEQDNNYDTSTSTVKQVSNEQNENVSNILARFVGAIGVGVITGPGIYFASFGMGRVCRFVPSYVSHGIHISGFCKLPMLSFVAPIVYPFLNDKARDFNENYCSNDLIFNISYAKITALSILFFAGFSEGISR